MGIHDRAYYRDDWSPRRYGSQGSSMGDWEVWKWLIAINVVVFLLQIFITRPPTESDLDRSPYFNPEMYAEFDEETYQDEEASVYDNAVDANDPDQSETATEPSDDAAADSNSSSDAEPTEPIADSNESNEEATELDKWLRREQALRESRRAMLEYMPRMSIVQDYFELDSDKVKRGQVWRLITAGFCHDRLAIWHLAFNMLFLFWFGRRLEGIYGRAEFTAFYFTALIVSSLTYVALDLYTQGGVPAIGASGAVWGVVALYALKYPYERIYVYLLFPIEIRWLVLAYFIFDLHPVLLALSGDNQFTGVAHAAHIGGALFGFAYWKQGWRLMPLIEQWKRDLSFGRGERRDRDDDAKK